MRAGEEYREPESRKARVVFAVLDVFAFTVKLACTLILACFAAAILIGLGELVFHAWYVSTHCTMVLGTRVCQ